jgi:hypothetical protein
MFFALVLGFMMHPDLLFPAPALIIQGVAKYFGPYGGIIAVSLQTPIIICHAIHQISSLPWRLMPAHAKSISRIGLASLNLFQNAHKALRLKKGLSSIVGRLFRNASHGLLNSSHLHEFSSSLPSMDN